MSVDGFISAGPRLERTWRVALITSAAVDISLYALVLFQSIRYLYKPRRGSDADSAPLPQRSSTSERDTSTRTTTARDGKNMNTFSRRPWGWLVVVLGVVATFKAGCSIAAAILLRKPVEELNWPKLMTKLPFYIAPVLTATIAILTESFYLHRLFHLLRVQTSFLGSRWFRTIAILVVECLFLSALALAIYSTYIAADGWNYFAYYLLAHVSAGCFGDILVTVLTLACILGAKSNYHSAEKRSRLAQFARITALSAAIPTIIALVNVICVAIPSVMILLVHTVPNAALGQLFILSFLWTLEFRQRIAHQSTDRPSRRLTSPLGEVWRPSKKDGAESEMLNHTSMFARTIPPHDVDLELDRKSSFSAQVENVDISKSIPVSGSGRGYSTRVTVNRSSSS